MADQDSSSAPPADLRPAKTVVYCGVCSLPPEVGTPSTVLFSSARLVRLSLSPFPSFSPSPRSQLPPLKIPEHRHSQTLSLPTNLTAVPPWEGGNQYCEFGGTVKKCEEWLASHAPSLHATLYSAETVTANLSALSVDAQKRAEKDAQKKAAKASAAEARESERRAASKVVITRVERNKRKYVTEIAGLEAFGLELKKVAKEFGKKFATGSSVTKTAAGGEEITVQGDVSDDVFDWLTEHHDEIPEENIELVEDKKKKAAAAAATA